MRQNSPSLRNGSMERRATEKAQSKIYQLLFMWRIEHEELQKQKIKEQPGFVPPSRLGTNRSEKIATETKELTAARLARSQNKAPPPSIEFREREVASWRSFISTLWSVQYGRYCT